jgi:hypothetical protein
MLRDLIEWAPICCLAIEREPTAHHFHRALAVRTREYLLKEARESLISNRLSPITMYAPDDEIRLRDLVRFFLAPARCGMFLSRSALGQMAKAIGWRLPFGSRFDVAQQLFEMAGENDRVTELIRQLETEANQWAAAYRQWSDQYPAWQSIADRWLARTEQSQRTVSLMHVAVADYFQHGTVMYG